METTCKQCFSTFTPERADAQFCSGACRTAAYRKRHTPLPEVGWIGERPKLSDLSRTSALSNRELGARLLQIAERDDDGEAKTGRRYYLPPSSGRRSIVRLGRGWIGAPGTSVTARSSAPAPCCEATQICSIPNLA